MEISVYLLLGAAFVITFLLGCSFGSHLKIPPRH